MLSERHSFEAMKPRGHYIRHANYLGEISRVASAVDRADASFDVVEGLAARAHVSFRSANLPNHYLRHQNFRLVLSEFTPGDRLMHEDATFMSVAGLVFPLWSSFRSYNYPKLYIRHRDFHLYVSEINANSPEPDRSDATFLPVDAFLAPPETIRIVEIANDRRIFNSSGPRPPFLRLDKRLVAVAQNHSQDLAGHPGLWERQLDGFPGHYGSDNSTPQQRIQMAMGSAGTENVYVQWFWGGNVPPPSARAAHDWWWQSPPHRSNVLNPSHRSTGVGIATGQGRVPQGQAHAGEPATFHYYTQVFHSSA
ncbi:AbfB domain-containing protein [Streptosporangium amethystogenes]|uniref:AbfB domain-containing protein n=1 Tax=Streptosporangium amethystogenes TaxID=2002 RepID=UPI000691CE10|nr:AbfB domain-containing protein [Streptosporangium amethystogenes]